MKAPGSIFLIELSESILQKKERKKVCFRHDEPDTSNQNIEHTYRLLKYLQIIKHVEVVKDFTWYIGYRVILQKSVKEKWQSVHQIKQFSNRLNSSGKKIKNSEVINN